ncbi:hypothetical protein VIGAN_11155400 [Vigna angularis var. angularis]|nr:hypothetical protein VIGAN_11155400 [Vigna angularis var. angularis]
MVLLSGPLLHEVLSFSKFTSIIFSTILRSNSRRERALSSLLFTTSFNQSPLHFKNNKIFTVNESILLVHTFLLASFQEGNYKSITMVHFLLRTVPQLNHHHASLGYT